MAVDKARAFLDALTVEFNDIEALDPSMKLSSMIEWGEKLEAIQAEEMVEENFVKGCISTAYLVLETSLPNGEQLRIRGSSEALVIRGYMAILAHTVSLLTIKEVKHDLHLLMEKFVQNANLAQTLTPTRSNTLGNLVQMVLKKSDELSHA